MPGGRFAGVAGGPDGLGGGPEITSSDCGPVGPVDGAADADGHASAPDEPSARGPGSLIISAKLPAPTVQNTQVLTIAPSMMPTMAGACSVDADVGGSGCAGAGTGWGAGSSAGWCSVTAPVSCICTNVLRSRDGRPRPRAGAAVAGTAPRTARLRRCR